MRVGVDWNLVPEESARGFVTVASPGSLPVRVEVIALRVEQSRGHVEDAGVVSIEAEHATSAVAADGVRWQVLPGFGPTLSGMEAFPDTAPSTAPAPEGSPEVAQACLAYDFTTLSSGLRTIQFVLAPTLPFAADARLRFSFAVDGERQQLMNVWNPYTEAEWSKAVSDGVHRISASAGKLAAGPHTLRICRVDAGVVLERIVIFSGEKPPGEYLGPLESSSSPQTQTIAQ